MKTTSRKKSQSLDRPPKIYCKISRPSRFNLLTPLFLCLLLMGTLAGSLSAQTLQVAGDLIVNLQNNDLVAATGNVWTNEDVSPLSVGNFTLRSGTVLPITQVSYGPSGNLTLTTLNVNASGNNAVRSASTGIVPAELTGRGTVTVEAWVYPNDVGAVSCVEEYGTAANQQNREFNYSANAGQGAVSGFNADSSWTPTGFPTAGVLHYLVYEYDGTNFITYQDGVSNTTAAHANWATTDTRVAVGAQSGGGDPFHGSIGAVRVMSGLLTPAQILNNFNLGPLATYVLVPIKPTSSLGNSIYVGDTTTLTELVQGTGPFTYQWASDNGTGGATFTAIPNATNSTYVFSTTGLTPTNYEFEVSDTSASGNGTSAPLIIAVHPATQPIVSTQTTPAATSNVFLGYTVNFSAAFVGNQTITYQWQVSTNGVGGPYASVDPTRFPTGTNAALALTNLQFIDSGFYTLQAMNSFGSSNSTPVQVTVQPLSALPGLQVAGDLEVNLRSSDLSTNSAVWTNEIDGIGDFTSDNTLNLNVTNINFNGQSVKVLNVNNATGQSVISAQLIPSFMAGNGPESGEAWIYATALSGNGTVIAYGVQGGSGAPEEDRELDYGASSALSGDFGNLDSSWPGGTESVNTWHYLAWTYDGTTFRCYQDGVLYVSKTGEAPMPTVQTLTVIGGGIANSGPNITDPFDGNIAAVRVSSGVLSASQVLNNYIAGPLATVSVVDGPPVITPSNSVFYGNSVTASVTNAGSLQTLTFQWQADNGSAGVNWSNVTSQTDTNYSFSTTILPQSLTPTNYEYRLVATGNLGTIVTSAPVTLTVKPAAPPSVASDISPASATIYTGQQISFTAGFTGNEPITNQWQISTNGGASFVNLVGDTDTNATSSVTVTDLTATTKFRLKGSNFYGSTNSSVATVTVLPLSDEPSIQTAGEVIVDLEAADLNTNSTAWTNRSIDPNSVGDFTVVGSGSTLNVTNAIFNFQPINVLNVAGVVGNAVEAINIMEAPTILLGANPCSMDAWVNCTQVGSGNTAVNYGDQSGGAGAPDQDRALNYQSQPYGAFTAYFGNADLAWNPAPTANLWHYIAVTYDGSNLKVYQDGVLNNSSTGITLLTDDSYITVGCGVAGGPYGGNDQLSGYIAAARVETGVLTPAQIAQNFAAGPLVSTTIADLAPLTSSFANGSLTLTYAAGTLQSAPSPQGPWTAVNAAVSPYTVSVSSSIPGLFYRLQY